MCNNKIRISLKLLTFLAVSSSLFSMDKQDTAKDSQLQEMQKRLNGLTLEYNSVVKEMHDRPTKLYLGMYLGAIEKRDTEQLKKLQALVSQIEEDDYKKRQELLGQINNLKKEIAVLSGLTAKIAKNCGNCKASETLKKFQQCGKCKKIVYCSKSCQISHFKTHKVVCKVTA